MVHELAYSPPVAITDDERSELLAFAEQVAAEAATAALPFFRMPGAVDNKLAGEGFDPVTEGDRAVEARVRELVKARYPEHGILGEEYGEDAGNGLTWVIDPIDGTRAFMSGMLHWGLLLGLFNGESSVVGVMRQPFTQESFYGDTRQAFYRRNDSETQRLSVSNCESLADAVVASTGPQLYASAEEQAQFLELQNRAKMTRLGCDCYAYGMLAMGYVDVAADPGLQAYDIQGLIPVIEGAGGVVTTWSGSDPNLGGAIVASATPALHAEVLQRLGSS